MKKTTKKKATKKKAAPKKKKKTAKKVTPKKSADIPATYGALDLVRAELKSEITSVKLEMKAGFAKVDSRFEKIDSQFKTMESRFEKLQSTNERMLALIEEQAQQNKHVLDGHKNLHDRQDRFESEIREEIADIKHVISISKSTNKSQ